MENTRPYWKVIVSLALSLTATVLVIVIGINALIYFMPFVIGWLIASIANPLVCWLEKKMKIEKKFGSALIIILVLAAVIGLLYLGISRLVSEASGLIAGFPELYNQMSEGFKEIGDSLSGFFQILPRGIRNGILTLASNFEETMGNLISKMSEPTVNAAGRFAKSLPNVLIATIVTIISAYFFIADRENVIAWLRKVTPEPLERRVSMVVSNLKYAVGGYFKAQFKIMGVVFLLLLVGFAIMDVHYGAVFAILIAFLDFLPFFGTGTALIPWAVYKLLVGNYKMAVMLLVLYGVTQLVRQLIQPKLVGDGVGLKPLPTLVFIYLGYKIGSVLGMILAVPVGMIVINMYQAGAFDYIMNDVKILVKGIMSLRE